MATLTFCDFDEALEAVESAPTEEALSALIDTINQLFESDCLEVTPRDWAHLASATMFRTTQLRDTSPQ
ncbi:hypothetical protein HBO10_29815 [Pseudomonas sp. WS 5503]|uniref:hypothetical protein n=1 Tax=Pseudomonas TaxID=286 RepID=UPI001472A8E5|nr:MULTISPECIES: hypothetical protein [Pseudomonas]NMX83706.1 hypothetical protein [Pseudomonas sp. WS 5503]NNB23586.1 hypothetical protein [Pseudomonas fragi]